MIKETRQLTSKDILDKDFKVAMRGYNQAQVDEFLDIIIQDYSLFNKQLEQLKNENENLKKQVAQTNNKRVGQPVQQVNYDVLKRLSNLEKEVFGRKFADS